MLFPELSNQLIVFSVGADPIPDDVIFISDADGAVIQPDPYGINGTGRMNGFEVQAWVKRVLDKKTNCLPRLFRPDQRSRTESARPSGDEASARPASSRTVGLIPLNKKTAGQ